MPFIFRFPLWRVYSPIVWRSVWTGQQQPPDLSDKIARDAGIDPQTLAELRHTWPSEAIPQAQHDHLVRHIKGL